MQNYLKKIPEGYSEGIYNKNKYGITKTIFNNGRSIKLYAEELGGTDFISLNYYITKTKDLLKPCEMPEAKVIDFVKSVVLLTNEKNNP
ncbi:MAG: peptide methionine sulfoxide reductase [Flavobacteriaceae bacterium]|nr:peptide methionine sulfoxide reductase [Flavobacteriaceae bacterium]